LNHRHLHFQCSALPTELPVAAGEQAQTLRGLVEKLGLGQNPAPDGYNGIRGQNIGAAELLVLAHKLECGVRFCPGEPIGAGARELSALWGLVDIGRT
jgi:hypothetical protein